jgi:hypothetical protein
MLLVNTYDIKYYRFPLVEFGGIDSRVYKALRPTWDQLLILNTFHVLTVARMTLKQILNNDIID